MRVLIIGSGLIGTATAYYLRRIGAEVRVLDRAAAPAMETSYANAGLLTPSLSQPWNSPDVLRKILGYLGREDAPMLLRTRALPSLLGWGLDFLRHSRAERVQISVARNLRLALHSLDLMDELRRIAAASYEGGQVGTLKLLREPAEFERACRQAEQLSAHGIEHTVLEPAALAGLDEALAPIATQLAGGIHFPRDEHGDARQFCTTLARTAQDLGVSFEFGVTVTALERRGDRIDAVLCGDARYQADAYVLAAGSFSTTLARSAGIALPVRPGKGYSITLATQAWKPAPRVPLVEDSLHIALTPLGNRLRVAGTAEFAGYDTRVRPGRIDNLVRGLRQVFPRAPIPAGGAIQPWAGLRPISSDGVPILGATPLENLYVNTGHGPLGWTLAAASGKTLTDIITGATPALPAHDYALARFHDPRSPAHRGRA